MLYVYTDFCKQDVLCTVAGPSRTVIGVCELISLLFD